MASRGKRCTKEFSLVGCWGWVKGPPYQLGSKHLGQREEEPWAWGRITLRSRLSVEVIMGFSWKISTLYQKISMLYAMRSSWYSPQWTGHCHCYHVVALVNLEGLLYKFSRFFPFFNKWWHKIHFVEDLWRIKQPLHGQFSNLFKGWSLKPLSSSC